MSEPATESENTPSESTQEIGRFAIKEDLEKGSTPVLEWSGRLGSYTDPVSGGIKYKDVHGLNSPVGPIEVAVSSFGSVQVKFIDTEHPRSKGSEVASLEDEDVVWKAPDFMNQNISYYSELRATTAGAAVIAKEETYGLVRKDGKTYLTKTTVGGVTDDWQVSFKMYDVTGKID
jgi:hypothetical protein